MRFKKYLWEFVKLFNRRQIIMIKPSMKCNLKCPYCSVNKVAGGSPPEYEEQSYVYWMNVIQWVKPKMVAISGGEPGIYKDLHKIVNFCTKNKILVQIVTNLTCIDEYDKIKPSWRVMFWSTYHHSSRVGIYLFNYLDLKRKFVIVTKELEKPKRLSFSRMAPLRTEFTNTIYPYKIFAPNGRVFYSCYEIDKNE